MQGIFDSHAHYDDNVFDNNRETIIEKIHANGVCGIINVGCSLKSSQECISLSEKYPFIWASVGLHPDQADSTEEGWLEKIEAMSKMKKVVAIGEIGLDYHYKTPPDKLQLPLFEEQLKLARRQKLPVIIHSRDATKDTMELLRQYKPKGVLHCFSGSVETAKEVLSLGMYIGFTGIVTFPKAKKPKEVAAIVPLNRLLLETDCPYMAPVPFRGQHTTSDMIQYTASAIADVKNISAQEVIDAARHNTRSLFKI